MNNMKDFLDDPAVMLALFILALVLAMNWLGKDNIEYSEKCKAAGGVVVHTQYAMNCATEGYINIE